MFHVVFFYPGMQVWSKSVVHCCVYNPINFANTTGWNEAPNYCSASTMFYKWLQTLTARTTLLTSSVDMDNDLNSSQSFLLCAPVDFHNVQTVISWPVLLLLCCSNSIRCKKTFHDLSWLISILYTDTILTKLSLY